MAATNAHKTKTNLAKGVNTQVRLRETFSRQGSQNFQNDIRVAEGSWLGFRPIRWPNWLPQVKVEMLK